MSESKKPISKIPTGRFSRGVRLARLTASVGASALGGKMATMFSSVAEKETNRLLSQVKQARKVADALSQMKGAAMKLGQILSIHGEHLFPKEVTDALAKLQQSSDEMDFAQIEKVLKRELGPKLGSVLVDVSRRPIASASIGQVHQARYQTFDAAVKVQYPGVDRSIDSDVDSLASVLSVLTRIPSMESFNSVTDEIKTILRQETDYEQEATNIEFFRQHLGDDDRLVIPRVFRESSTKRVLTTELVKGISVQEFADSTASQAARNAIGMKYLEVFYKELFNLGRVQTDPNFANYKIQWSFGQQDPKLVLLDFGAVKTFDDRFRANYRRLVRACLADDYEGVRVAAVEAGFLREDEDKALVDMHWQLIKMFMEPFIETKPGSPPYAWNRSDLAERVAKFMPKFVFAFKLRPPPKDFIFLNRKVVGIYFFCSAIKAEFNPRPLLEKYSQ